MAAKKRTRDEDIQAILMNAVEVQLAAFQAGIGFWSEWVEQARKFSEETIRLMVEIQSDPSKTSRLLLEMTDVSRASLRALSDLPRHTAETFVDALDEFEKARKKPVSKRRPRKKPARKKAHRRKARAKP